METPKPDVIPCIKDLGVMTLEKANKTLASAGFKGKIDKVNWKAFSYKPAVSFYLAHDNRHIFILYKVSEENIRARYVTDNDAVWEDSCVEAFFAMEKGYFNVEVNCIGTALAAYGKGRDNRIHLGVDQMKKIKRTSSLGKGIIGKDNVNADWWLQLAIPLDLLGLRKGGAFRANFYKCGDKCKTPHFLSWQPIETLGPDFHQPAFFTELLLE